LSAPAHQDFLVLANPVAGRGDAPRRAAAVARELRAAGERAELVVTRDLDHARVRAREAGGAVVVAAGGDGFVGAVAEQVAASQGVLGVVPAGRGNDLARALGVSDDDDPDTLARGLLAHEEQRRVDLLGVGDRLVAGSVATGIDAAADAWVHGRRAGRLPAQVAYRVAALRSLLRFRPPVYDVRLDGAPALRARAYTVVVANAASYGAGLRIAPGARVEDGLLDVVVIGAFARRRFPGLLAALRTGAHTAWPEVTLLRGRSVRIVADAPLAARADGEPLAPLPIDVEIRPGTLQVRGGARPLVTGGGPPAHG
jgi:diacylglycerol kinase (ATP)